MTEVQTTTRENLRWIVDHLPEWELKAMYQVMLEYLSKHDPLLYGLVTAPEDDPTEEELVAIQEAHESIARGEPTLSTEELRRELGL